MINETMARVETGPGKRARQPRSDRVGRGLRRLDQRGRRDRRRAAAWPTQPVRPHAFGTTWQFSFPRRNFVLRTDGMPVSLIDDVRAAVRRVDPSLATGTINPLPN